MGSILPALINAVGKVPPSVLQATGFTILGPSLLCNAIPACSDFVLPQYLHSA